MKIKLKRRLFQDGMNYAIGEIVEVNKDTADTLIKFGQAELVVEEKIDVKVPQKTQTKSINTED